MSVAGKRFARSCLIGTVWILGEGGQNLPNSLVDSFLGFRVRRERFVVPQISGTEANGSVAVRHDDLSKCFGLCRFKLFPEFVTESEPDRFLDVLEFLDHLA